MSLTFIDCETTGTDPARHAVWEIAIITDSGEYSWVLGLTRGELAVADAMALHVGRYYERAQQAEDGWESDKVLGPGMVSFTRSPSTVEHRRDQWKKEKFITVDQRSSLASFLAHEIGNSHLVGAVPSFDARFVGDFIRTHGRRVPSWHYHLIDVEALAAGHLKREPPWKSKDLYAEIGVDLSQFPEHTALGDARMAKAVYETVMSMPAPEQTALTQGVAS